MRDTLFDLVLECIMIPKESYDFILEYATNHSDYRTKIPDAKFVDYNKSFAMMERFINDAIGAINTHQFSNDQISVATQKFITETADLWPTHQVYHNRILQFMESAYRVPENARNLRAKLVMENPQLSDAITYMTRKYLEAYMDHIIPEMDFINGYIGNGDKVVKLTESTQIKGYYMPEDLGNQIASLPGMIIALVKKLMNALSLTLSEASRSFANRILANNQINENAIQEIYKLYQAKNRAGTQPTIMYPDPKQVNSLRQAYAAGFGTFVQQMTDAINKGDFQGVDQGVVKMIQQFHVVGSNQGLPRSASYQEFRTAVLSIANNILIMDDFLKALKQIEDTIEQKYGVDPKSLDKALEGSVKKARTDVRQAEATQQNASVEEQNDAFYDMFEDADNSPKNSGSNNDTSKNPGVVSRIQRGAQNVGDNWIEYMVERFLNRFLERFSVGAADTVADALINMLSGAIGMESAEMTSNGSYLSEADINQTNSQPATQNTNKTNQTQQNQPQVQQDQTGDNAPIDVSALGLAEDGEMSENIFSLDYLQKIISQCKLTQWVTESLNILIETIKDLIGSGEGKSEKGSGQQDSTQKPDPSAKPTNQNTSAQQNTNKTNQTQQNQPSKSQPQQNKPTATNASVEFIFDDELMEEAFKDVVKGLFTVGEFKAGKSFVLGKMKRIQSVLKKAGSANVSDLPKMISSLVVSIYGKIKGLDTIGKVRTYIENNDMKGFMADTALKRDLTIFATIAVAISALVLIQAGVMENPLGALSKSVAGAKAGKLPPPKRANENINASRNAVPKIAVDLWNNADAAVKNLWQYINGWLYGGQKIQGSKDKTVGIAEIIRQEIQSLAPYVNMKDVIKFDRIQ